MKDTPRQLALGISLGSDLDFRGFVSHGNEAPLQAVRDALDGGQFVYLWGETGSGRTHLLHAACREVASSGRRAGLLPLRESGNWSPALLEGWESLDVVAIDDVDAIAGDNGWEHALFSLYNGLRDAKASLLVTASCPPARLALGLPDLRSRLGAMLVYQLRGLDDAGRMEALVRKARARGLELPEETGRYLLTRMSRNMRDLAALLEQLDQASLAHQRRLTVPFVREQLEAKSR